MPTSLTIKLKGEEGHHHGSYMASLLQGVIMEKIDPVYAEEMHVTGAHPYSQYLLVKDDALFWTVNALSEEAEKQIIMPLLEDDEKSIFLNHRNESLSVESKALEKVSFEELVQKYYLENCSRNLTLRFLTPTGFKQGESTVFFPRRGLFFRA